MSTEHSKRAAKFTQNVEKTTWHDNTFWSVRQKRDNMAQQLPEWEDLREHASEIKKHTITHLADYLDMFSKNLESRGVKVHWAKDAQEFNEIVLGILKDHNVKKMVKSKSMLTEECEMNPYLEQHGIDVVETDLGERIMQLLHEPPSHIVLPAIGVRREEVGELFEREFGTEHGNSDPTYLTHEARRQLRPKFLGADIAMTGVNFAVASTGTLAVCTNEGNADMGTSFPDLHIAIMGLEKVIPDMRALAVFTRLLARSGTGQPVTSYTSLLKCLRCGACMNTCPVYRRSGGYSYSYFIPGPLGINLSMLRSPKLHHGNVSACSLCYSCSDVCPAMIDLGEQIYAWRQELAPMHLADPVKKLTVKGMDFIMGGRRRFYGGIALARPMHIFCSFWSFVLMALHLGLHWKMVLGMVRWVTGPVSSPVLRSTLRIGGAAVAVYGLYALVKNQMVSYLLLQSSFVFFDFERPLPLFFTEYLAIMGLFVFLAHYGAWGVQRLTKKG